MSLLFEFIWEELVGGVVTNLIILFIVFAFGHYLGKRKGRNETLRLIRDND